MRNGGGERGHKAVGRRPRPNCFFVPGRLICFAQYGPDTEPSEPDLRQRLSADDAVQSVCQRYDRLKLDKRLLQPAPIARFPASERRGRFALVTVDLEGVPDTEILALTRELNAAVLGTRTPGEPVRPAPGTVALAGVAPDWLASSAHHLWGTGGPGARPVPYVPPGGSSSLHGQRPWHLEHARGRAGNGTAPRKRDQGAGIAVALLDTVPCAHDLARAYHIWQNDNELITSLLRPDGPLHVSYAPYATMVAIAGLGLARHAYPMADHGLFAAGIIHSLAPAAELHLVEVLGPYGVGTLSSIAEGFQRIMRMAGGTPMLVNASLTLSIPNQPEFDRLGESRPVVDGLDLAAIELQSEPIQAMCDAMQAHNLYIVAAAGNDGLHGKRRRAARYPAACDEVLGVGALDAGFQPTSYSNLADLPARAGVATFGGEAITAGGYVQADPDRGIVGVFTGAFPNGAPNRSGLARWAGTSFACPVVCGLLAGAVAPGFSRADVVAALHGLIAGPNPIGQVIEVSQA